jgi:hypothetical protein
MHKLVGMIEPFDSVWYSLADKAAADGVFFIAFYFNGAPVFNVHQNAAIPGAERANSPLDLCLTHDICPQSLCYMVFVEFVSLSLAFAL